MWMKLPGPCVVDVNAGDPVPVVPLPVRVTVIATPAVWLSFVPAEATLGSNAPPLVSTPGSATLVLQIVVALKAAPNAPVQQITNTSRRFIIGTIIVPLHELRLQHSRPRIQIHHQQTL